MKRAALTYGRLALGIGIGVGLGWFAIRGLDWGLVVDHLSRVSPLMIALALAVFMASGVVRAARWRMLFVEPRPSVARLFIVQHEGLGLSNIMPLRVASELTQIAVLTIKDGLRASTVLAAIGMERVVDFLSSMLIFGIAFMLVPEMRPLAPYVMGTIGLGVILIGTIQVLAWRGESLWLVRRITFLVAFSNALRNLVQDWKLLLRVFAVSIVYWLLVGVSAWITSDAIGLPISALTATLVIIGTIFFATAIPAPSGIGTFHFAVVFVLGLVDVMKADAFPFAVIVHLLFFAPPTIIMAFFLPREGISWKRAGEEQGAKVKGEKGE
ncbi:MAG: lysylphosphatidylglycerol synthase transmembrane domain-containing protein [Chloroflexi bacterium]|nr:lysylphosphatidylglycerol synthase transmembrane domain-containing protein [Chloroflexota bacterium]